MNDSIKISSSFCFENYDVFQILIGLTTLLLSYLTFRLAIKVHKEFLKNHAKSKQVEKMSDLVEFLNNTKIYLIFTNFYPNGGIGGTSYDTYYNIFEIGDLLGNKTLHNLTERTIDNSDYDDFPVYLDSGSQQIMDIKKFVDNPFVPKQIADKLFDFFVIKYEIIELSGLVENKTSAVILNSAENNDDFKNFKETNCEALKSWLSLKTHSKNLTKIISEWFLEKGIDDYNVRIDYKNIRK